MVHFAHKREMLVFAPLRFCVMLLACTLCLVDGHAPAHEAVGEKGMIATGHALATEAGVEVFRDGGNAVDAAVAAALTLGVVDGNNSGLGGGCLILIRCGDGRLTAIDGREMAPAAAHKDMFVRDGVADSRSEPDRAAGGRRARRAGRVQAGDRTLRHQ